MTFKSLLDRRRWLRRGFASFSRRFITNPFSVINIIVSGNILGSVQTLAANGINQATASPLTKDNNYVTVASGVNGCRLPTAVPGMCIMVKNVSTLQTLKVYPATGAAINETAANGAVTMAASQCTMFNAQTATQWYTQP